MGRTKIITEQLERYKNTQKEEAWVPRLIEKENNDPLQSVSFNLEFKHREPVVLKMHFPQSYPFTPSKLILTPVPEEIEECCIGNQFLSFTEKWSPIDSITIQVLSIYSLITDAVPHDLFFEQPAEDLQGKGKGKCMLKRKRSAEWIEDPDTNELRMKKSDFVEQILQKQFHAAMKRDALEQDALQRAIALSLDPSPTGGKAIAGPSRK